MNFLKPIPECKPKERAKHPLEKIIKPKFYDRLKYVHNSVNNPQYPRNPKELKKTATPPEQMVTLTVIGDYLHKDFVECVVIAKHFFKYKSRRFNCPKIRGVTDVDWPTIRRELNDKYGVEVLCLSSPVVVLVNDLLLGGRKHLHQFLKKRFRYHFALNMRRLQVEHFVNYVKSSGRPFAYMHIFIANEMAGVLIFKLYSDLVPRTCENFLRLCATRRGGYAGTPVHRVVTDCWVQAGGFGLKDTDLGCENFIVPPDRRGVLCMANDGRDIDCSTQFFILLQPAPWMAQRYVAFGQLVRGEETLKKIESVPTYYEAPLKEIIIARAGILNLDCHGTIVSRETNQYLDKHIEDLAALGVVLYKDLMERVSQELEFREVARLAAGEEEDEEDPQVQPLAKSTKRFIRDKKKHNAEAESLNEVYMDDSSDAFSSYFEEEQEPPPPPPPDAEVVLAEVPFYLPLTDVPYPDEVPSTFDLKRFLAGDYCLASDLGPSDAARVQQLTRRQAELAEPYVPPSIASSVDTIDSDDDIQIRTYISECTDRVSFAGHTIAEIASNKLKYKHEGPGDTDRLKKLSDEELRQIRHNDVHIAKEKTEVSDTQIEKKRKKSIWEEVNRAHNKFERDSDVTSVHTIGAPFNYASLGSADNMAVSIGAVRKVRIMAEDTAPSAIKMKATRRPTGFVKLNLDELERADPRQSILTRLYDEVAPMTDEDYCPTLKNYRPFEVRDKKTSFLTATAPVAGGDERMKSILADPLGSDKAAAYQHAKKFVRQMSSDYLIVTGREGGSSLRSIEYLHARPTLSVDEYQKQNAMRGQGNKNMLHIPRLRLPGDTPLHSIAVPRLTISNTGSTNSVEQTQEPFKIGSTNYNDYQVRSIITNMLQKKIAEGALPTPNLRLPGDTPLFSYSEPQ